MFDSKAQADEKAQHTSKYVSILKGSVMLLNVIKSARIPLSGATQLSDIRRGFEVTSNKHSANAVQKGSPLSGQRTVVFADCNIIPFF
jgi:hypothetical protein